MDIEYVDILTGENLSQKKLTSMDLNHWPVWSSRGRVGDRVKRVILSSQKFYLIRVHENLVQHQINYTSIDTGP